MSVQYDVTVHKVRVRRECAVVRCHRVEYAVLLCRCSARRTGCYRTVGSTQEG